MRAAMILLFLLTISCRDEDKAGACDKPDWLKQRISFYEMQTEPASIIVVRYQYQRNYVFLIDECHRCLDAMQLVMNCQKDTICIFGGIAGHNTCPGFFDKASDSTLIYMK